MIQFNDINIGIEQISMPEYSEIGDESDDIQLNVIQSELMKLIHQQFQRPAIKKLYPYPQWTERVFWIIHGNIYHQFEDLSMDRLSEHIEQYIIEHGYPGIKSVYSQRDTAKLVIDSIKDLEVDGKTKLTDLTESLLKAGITADKIKSTMKQMKQNGSVFEPSEGYYRCV